MLTRAVNVGAMAAALVLSMLSSWAAPNASGAPVAGVRPSSRGLRVVKLADGTEALLDAGGHAVPRRNYRRIVAGSTVADELVVALCEPDRIAGLTKYSVQSAPHPHRFMGWPTHDGLNNVEQVVALRPDLVVTHGLSSSQSIVRLREQGVAVFDMGEMRGLSTLPGDVHELAWLLGDPARGDAYAERFTRQMAAVVRGLAKERRKSALYIAVYGDKLFGGTRGTSYHDVMTAAGLVDVAAVRYRDWPAYTAEDLLALDPEWIVTSIGMGAVLCRRPGLSRLRACSGAGAIAEIGAPLSASAGPPMLEAAEQLYERVYADVPRARRAGTAP